MFSIPLYSAEPRRDFDIPAGPAADSVRKFVDQADLSVIYEADRLTRFKTNAVKGIYEPAHALRKLLAGSGLDFSVTHSGFLSVSPREKGRKHPVQGDLPTINISGRSARDSVSLPVGVTLKVITGKELTQQGFTTVSDWARTLPQNQGTGAYEASSYLREAPTNIAYGSGLNLFGIGQRATLILVNNRRLAPSGSAGSFTDVLNIPISAVDHIELISDGAATIYGADAIGGIVNFVLRSEDSRPLTTASFGHLTRGDLAANQVSQSYARTGDGWRGVVAFEHYTRSGLRASDRSQATSNVTPWGGSNFDIVFGNPPSLIDRFGRIWGIPAGQDGRSLTAAGLSTQPNLYDRHADTWILPRQERFSVLADASYDLTDDIRIFIESLFSQRRIETYTAPSALVLSVPDSNPFYVNPIAGDRAPVQVLYGFGKDLGPITERGTVNSGQFSLGLQSALSERWHLRVSGSFTFDDQRDLEGNLVNIDALTSFLEMADPSVAFNPFADGSNNNPATLAAIRSQGTLDYRSAFSTAEIELVGSIPLLPAGDVTLTAGYERRYQTFWSAVSPDFSFVGEAFNMDLHRTLNAAYVQASVPVLSGDSLSLNLGGGLRYEYFSDAGSALMPTFGWALQLHNGLAFTSTWARMFRPPNLSDLDESVNYSAVYPLPDPKSPTGYTTTLVWGGNNAQLSPETAHSWMVGIEYSPPSQPALSLETQYFNIVSSHQVLAQQLLASNVLADPRYSYLSTRDVTPSAIDNICSHSTFYGSPGQCQKADIGAIVDLRLRAAQTVKTDGIDLKALYALDTGIGRLNLNLQATYVLHFEGQPTSDGGWINYRNTPHNPIALRLRGVVGWENRNFFVTPAANFQGSYTDNFSVPNRPVGSWTTWDLSVGYKPTTLNELSGSKATISLHALNVFNKQPPFLNNDVGMVAYDPENGDLLGRRLSLRIEVEW